MFQEIFWGTSREVSKRKSKGVSRHFQRRFKEVSRVLASVKCVSRKFQWCFKNILMKFCFAILLLHGSHRSYPSRRRVCFLNTLLSPQKSRNCCCKCDKRGTFVVRSSFSGTLERDQSISENYASFIWN